MTQDKSGKKPKAPTRTTTRLAGSPALRNLQALMNSHPNPGSESKEVVRTTNAPPPVRPLTGTSFRPPGPAHGTPDWSEWAHIPSVALQEACALSMCIDPHTLVYERMDRSYEPDTSDEPVKKEFAKRLRMLRKNIYEPCFSPVPTGDVRLSEFAWWAQSIVRWPNLPPELNSLAEPPPSRRAAAPAKQSCDASGDATLPPKAVGDWREEARAIADELFDRDTEHGVRDSLLTKKGRGGYAFRVMGELQARGIHGPRGRIVNAGTVAKEALQGDKWWGRKLK